MSKQPVRIAAFSQKQMKALCWWNEKSPYKDYDSIICDGAVRSGKTFCMSLSFVLWAMSSFDGADFALCGKTISSLQRNLITPLLPQLKSLGFETAEKISRHLIEITGFGSKNRFYIFGGKDEGSASLIQGITLAGVLLDEVVLMPRSFVEQALARCSVEGSKLWFNCNPGHPSHWFNEEWIKKAESKNALYLHFTMADNPSLSASVRERYRRLYSGAFYERYVEGRWVAATGCVYPMFSEKTHLALPPERVTREFISCDYGTVNPSSFGVWGECGKKWYRLREYYYDSSVTGVQRTDEEHYAALEELAGDDRIEAVIVDPSAASFIQCIKRHGRFRVIAAENDVIAGIRTVSEMLRQRTLLFSPACKDIIREFGLYRWNTSSGKDSVIKLNDHAMDDMRYFVMTALHRGNDSFFAVAGERRNATWV